MITYSLSGKRALVTGAASGIGLATVELLARSGAYVALNDLPSNPQLEEQVRRLQTEGLKVLAAPGNVGDPDDAKAMVDNAIGELGGLDYLVNNAGTPGTTTPLSPGDFGAQDEAFWSKLLNVNLQGPYRCTAAAASALTESKGAIVNTASTAGLRGNGSSAVYAATKSGLISLTEEHARSLGPSVRVNAIAPGIVHSDWECRFNVPQEVLDTLPLQRAGNPEDFADIIVYLLVGAQYVTGQVVVADGGRFVGPRSPWPIDS